MIFYKNYIFLAEIKSWIDSESYNIFYLHKNYDFQGATQRITKLE